MKTLEKQNIGFTLIELLIVVAIIAILAAIAVPNFLEAQTRAKVARVKADHRAMATAIEAYSVDYNRPPVGTNSMVQGGVPWAKGTPCISNPRNYYALGEVYGQFTTPVAYISAIPEDPFIDKGTNTTTGAFGGNIFPGDQNWPHYHDHICPYFGNQKALLAAGYTWAIISLGPSRIQNHTYAKALLPGATITGPTQQVIYDSTNGTVSKGLIIRTNKGITGAPGT